MRTLDIRSFLLPGVLAVVAAGLTLVYIAHAGSNQPVAAKGTGATVYVAAHDIAAGTTGADALHAMRLAHVPATSLAPGAVTNPAQLTGRVATTPTYAGQQVVLASFAGSAQAPLAAQLHGNLRAMQLTGSANQVLAGSLKAGDHVDVIASVKTEKDQIAYGRTVARNLLVLTAPPDPSSSGVASTPTYSVTLRASDAQAQTLFFVATNGSWSLELRPMLHARSSAPFLDSVNSIVEEGR